MRAGFLLPVLLLAACSDGRSTTGATPGEDAALNDAAASLDANSAETNEAVIVDEGEGSSNEDDSGDQTQ